MPTFAIYSQRKHICSNTSHKKEFLVDNEIENIAERNTYDDLGHHLRFEPNRDNFISQHKNDDEKPEFKNKGGLESMNVIFMPNKHKVYIMTAAIDKFQTNYLELDKYFLKKAKLQEFEP